MCSRPNSMVDVDGFISEAVYTEPRLNVKLNPLSMWITSDQVGEALTGT